MSRIFRDSSVLNQFGSPSINSNIFANRPAFGQAGRLFVSTDTLAIFRDTGTAWDNLTDNPGNIGTLEEVTTNGNTTTLGIFAGASGSLTAGRLLEVKGKSLFTDNSGNILFIGLSSITPTTSTLDVYGYTLLRNTVDTVANLGPLLYAQYTLNYAGVQLSGFANSIFAQDIYNVSASTTVASSTQSGTSLNINTYKFSTVSTITFTQPAGTIRAASALTSYSQFQNTAVGTITHAAGITILGIENIGGSALNITNNYQLLINASDEFASTATITNRYGIYQGGINDNNYFAAKINIGNSNTTFNSSQLNVIGTSQLISTSTSGTSIIFGNTSFQWNFNTSIAPQILSLGHSANNVLNIGFDAPNNLINIFNAGNIDIQSNFFTIGGNSNSPISSARFAIESTTKGAIIPRMTTAQINAIASPVNGLLAYSTDGFVLCFYDSSVGLWKKVTNTNL